MPDMYGDGEYDLAGFCVGIVDNAKLVDGSGIRVGDKIVGLASTGLHSNGFSLARKILAKSGLGPDDPFPGADGATVRDVLLAPTQIYVEVVRSLLRDLDVRGMAHITGGGITENLNRALADDVDAVVTRNGAEMGWDVPPVITYVSRQAELAPNEACKTFNMGVGLCLIVAPEDEAAVTEALVALGEKPFRVGECVEGSGKVVYSDER